MPCGLVLRGYCRPQTELTLPEMRDLRLPADLCARAETKFHERFGTVEELLAFLLSELLRDDAEHADSQEQQILEQRLRDLGYL